MLAFPLIFGLCPLSLAAGAGKRSAAIQLSPLATARDNQTAVLSLTTEQLGLRIGCPAQSLIVIRK